MDKVVIEVLRGVEGPSLYVNDYRVAGPKPWGGGSLLHRFVLDSRGAAELLERLAPQEAE